MNASFADKTNLMLLAIFSASLLTFSCSKKLYPAKSVGTAVNVPEDESLKSSEIIKPEIKPAVNDIELHVAGQETYKDKEEAAEFINTGTGKSFLISGITPDQIIETAEKYKGVRHCMGGTTMKCVDCSGLLMVVFASHGISLPHNSHEQSRYGMRVRDKNELKRGDLVFFSRSYNTSHITHSGIYIGDGRFIHTSSSKGVTVTPLSNSYWEKRFAFGTRIFE